MCTPRKPFIGRVDDDRVQQCAAAPPGDTAIAKTEYTRCGRQVEGNLCVTRWDVDEASQSSEATQKEDALDNGIYYRNKRRL